MSTLKVNDITEATSGGGKIWPSRAWVNFNGQGTVAIRSDGNVSSITDNGTGQYTTNFSNALSSANYAVGSTAGYGSTTATDGGLYGIYGTSVTTTSVRGFTFDSSGSGAALYDYAYVLLDITL